MASFIIAGLWTGIKYARDYKFDIIFHIASLYDYFAPLETLRQVNVEGIRNLLDVILETQDLNHLRFIHWSTCGVYGEPKYQKDEKGYPIPNDETAPYNPPNNYSISKMEQELALKDYIKNTQLKATIIRPAPIMGPYQIYGMFHVFQLLFRSGLGPGIHVYPRTKRLAMPLIHVEDLVKAALFLSQKEESIGEDKEILKGKNKDSIRKPCKQALCQAKHNHKRLNCRH